MSILVGIEWLTITENKRRKEEPINAKQNERAALPAHKAFREKHRQTDGQTQTYEQTDKHMETDKQMERQTDRLTDRETDRQKKSKKKCANGWLTLRRLKARLHRRFLAR